MRRRLLVVVMCATLVGVFASVLVYRVVAGVQAASRDRAGNTESIVAAAVNIALAETITTDHVRLADWPKTAVPAGALKSLAAAEGRVVRSSIVAGEPLLEGKLAPQLSGRGGIMPMLVPEGQRGVTIKVDEAVRESGFILPNSHVDVLVSLGRGTGSQERVSKLILQDVLVLAAGQAVEMRDNKPVSVTTVTLALTPEQTERLALASTEGRLMLATRNLKDDRTVRTPGVTVATLLEGVVGARRTSGGGGRAHTAPARRAAEGLPADAHIVAVLRAGKVSTQVFVPAGNDWREYRPEGRR